MSGSILKYFGEAGGDQSEHGGLLHWPGTTDGFPFRANQNQPVPNLRQDEIDDIPTSVDFHCQTFKLWEPEEQKEYIRIRDRAANRWYHIHFIDRQTEDHDKISVYMEWYQIYGELRHGGVPQHDGHHRQDAVKSHIQQNVGSNIQLAR